MHKTKNNTESLLRIQPISTVEHIKFLEIFQCNSLMNSKQCYLFISYYRFPHIVQKSGMILLSMKNHNFFDIWKNIYFTSPQIGRKRNIMSSKITPYWFVENFQTYIICLLSIFNKHLFMFKVGFIIFIQNIDLLWNFRSTLLITRKKYKDIQSQNLDEKFSMK